MGIYDRDYYREEPRGFSLGTGRSMVTNIVLVTVILFIIDQFTTTLRADPSTGFGTAKWLSDAMALQADSLLKPWLWWQLLTYGFAHDPSNVMHVGFNMFILWMFGRDVEMTYGRGEFLRLYLTMIVFSGLVWAIYEHLTSSAGQPVACIGASGAVTGVLILFALNFPRRILLLFFVLPVPAWIVAVMVVIMDLAGFSRGQGGEVAHAAHLAGAAFAFIYFQTGLNLGRLLPASFALPRLDGFRRLYRSRPRLRLHDPPEDERRLSAEVDRILEKIHQQGETSLTDQERRTLKHASRRYQQKRR